MDTNPNDRLRRTLDLIDRIQLGPGVLVKCDADLVACSGCGHRPRPCSDLAAELAECGEVLPMLAHEIRRALSREDQATLAEFGAELVLARDRLRQAIHHLLTSPARMPVLGHYGFKIETIYDVLLSDVVALVEANQERQQVA